MTEKEIFEIEKELTEDFFHYIKNKNNPWVVRLGEISGTITHSTNICYYEHKFNNIEMLWEKKLLEFCLKLSSAHGQNIIIGIYSIVLSGEVSDTKDNYNTERRLCLRFRRMSGVTDIEYFQHNLFSAIKKQYKTNI